MPIKLTTAAAITAYSPYKISIYGPPGVGKTSLVAQAEDPIFLACPPDEVVSIGTKKETANIPVIGIRTYDVAEEAITFAIKNQESKTIIVDNTTDLYEQCVTKALEDSRGKVSEFMWTVANRYFFDLIKPLLTCKKNVIIVSHDRAIKNENGEQIGINPNHGESLVALYFGKMHAFLYYRLVGQDRILHTAAFNRIAIKTRYDFPKEFKNPSWKDVVDAINSYKMEAERVLNESTMGNQTKQGLEN